MAETEPTSDVVPIRARAKSGGPAHKYSWPPFEADNTKAVKHGAYSKRIIDPMAAKIGNELVESYPHLRDFLEATLEYARVDAQVERLQMWVNEHGELDDEGEPTSANILLLRTRTHLLNLADRLGLTPLARAKLGRDVAATERDLVTMMQEIGDGSADDNDDT